MKIIQLFSKILGTILGVMFVFAVGSLSAKAQSNIPLYSTLLGGNGYDTAADIVFANGYAYVTGSTQSLPLDFFTTGVRNTYNATTCNDSQSGNVYVAKLSLAGGGVGDLIYATVLCSTGYDEALALTVNSAGEVYFVGNTQATDFYGLSGKTGGFIVKLNTNGTYNKVVALGSINASSRDIALDGSGNVYVGGAATATGAIVTTSGAYDTSFSSNGYDIFLMKFSPTLTKTYATYLGGDNSFQQDVYGVAVDAQGNVYLTGETASLNFPKKGPLNLAFKGGTADAFLIKLKTAGTGINDLIYSFYLGGQGWDQGNGLAVDTTGNVYLTGSTNSTNFPLVGAFDSNTDAGKDIFVTKVSADGTSLIYSTLLGGSGNEAYSAIAVDLSGNAYITGRTSSIDFPTLGAIKSTLTGSSDSFISKINPAGNKLTYSTYLGGDGSDIGLSLAIDAAANVFAVGETPGSNFVTTAGAYDTIYGGGSEDAYIVKLTAQDVVPPLTSTPTITPTSIPLLAPVLTPINNSDGASGYNLLWDSVNGAISYEVWEDDNDQFTSPVIRYNASGLQWSATNMPAGTYYYRVRACNGGCGAWSAVQVVSVCDTPGEALLVSPANDTIFHIAPPKLVWQEALNADAGYEIVIYQDDYNNPEITGYFYFSTPPTDGYSIPNQSALFDGLWHWRVRGINHCGGKGTWSAPHYFRYYHTKPATPEFNSLDDVYTHENFTISWHLVDAFNVYYRLRMQKSDSSSSEVLYWGQGHSFEMDKGAGIFNFDLAACYADPTDPNNPPQDVAALCSPVVDKLGVIVLGKPVLSIGEQSADQKSWKVHATAIEGAETYTIRTDNLQNGLQTEFIPVPLETLFISETDKSPGIYHYQLSVCAKGLCRNDSGVNVFITPTWPLSADPYEAVWLNQYPRPGADGYLHVQRGQEIDFTIYLQNLGVATLKNAPGYRQLVLATSKTPGRISAPPSTGYDNCFNGPGGAYGNPGPNCGLSYFHDSSWLSQYQLAAPNENQIAQGGVITIQGKLKIPDNAALGQFEEGFTLYVNTGTASSPVWQAIPNHQNGENDFTFVWAKLKIESAQPTPSVVWQDQTYAQKEEPDVYVADIPANQTRTMTATFKAVTALEKDKVRVRSYFPNGFDFTKQCPRHAPGDNPNYSAYAGDGWQISPNAVVAAVLNRDVAAGELVDFPITFFADTANGANTQICDEHFLLEYEDNGQWYPVANSTNGNSDHHASMWWRIKDSRDVIVDDNSEHNLDGSQFYAYGLQPFPRSNAINDPDDLKKSQVWWDSIFWDFVNNSEDSGYAAWKPNFPTSGFYKVEAYIPYIPTWTTKWSHNAKYQIFDGNGQRHEPTPIDQENATKTYIDRWVPLGEYYFTQGNNGGAVLLDTMTGEVNPETGEDAYLIVVFDAMKFTYIGDSLPSDYSAEYIPPQWSWLKKPDGTTPEPDPDGDQFLDVDSRDFVMVTSQWRNTSKKSWFKYDPNNPKVGAVVFATYKDIHDDIKSAPAYLGYDDCPTGPNCGKSYFGGDLWIDKDKSYQIASITTEVTPNEIAEFKLPFYIPDNAIPGKYKEDVALGVCLKIKSDGNCEWEWVTSSNGRDDGIQSIANVWVGFKIKPDIGENGIKIQYSGKWELVGDEMAPEVYIATADLHKTQIKLTYNSTGDDTFLRETVHDLVTPRNGYYAAINGTGFECINQGKEGKSAGSTLGIYNDDKKTSIVYGIFYKASIFGIDKNDQPYISRAKFDFPGENNKDASIDYVKTKIANSKFVVGYGRTIVDNGKYISSYDDTDDDYKTAIGITEDAEYVFLAVARRGVTTPDFAKQLINAGANRAILLDSGGSSQFESYAGRMPNHKTICGDDAPTRRVINSIVVYNPNSQTTIQPSGGSYTLTPYTSLQVNNGTFDDTVLVNYAPQPVSSMPSTGALKNIGIFYNIDAAYSSNGLPAPIQPSKSYTITLRYDEANLPSSINEADLCLYHFDNSVWVKEPTCMVNTTTKTITASPNHFSLWAVLAPEKPTPTPTLTQLAIVTSTQTITTTLTPALTSFPSLTATPTDTQTITPTPTSTELRNVVTLQSIGGYDGWITESFENSGKGGAFNANAPSFNMGDNALKKQYIGILSFNTGASLPDNAVVTKVTLKVKKQGTTGAGNPLSIFQGLMVDIKKGFFGKVGLETSDFQAKPDKFYGPFKPLSVNNWYTLDLTTAKNYINKFSKNASLTQIRLRFKLDDNNNAVANYLSLYSGNAPMANRPQLIVEYYVP